MFLGLGPTTNLCRLKSYVIYDYIMIVPPPSPGPALRPGAAYDRLLNET